MDTYLECLMLFRGLSGKDKLRILKQFADDQLGTLVEGEPRKSDNLSPNYILKEVTLSFDLILPESGKYDWES